MGSWKQWRRAALTAAALAVVLDLLGAGHIQVTAYTVRCPGLPEAFSGLKIALITDLHGAFLDDGGQALAQAATGADLIAISGDLFDQGTQLEQVLPAIRALCRTAPVYYVSGNHEWTVENRREVWAQMEEAGVTLLDNHWVTLERQGASGWHPGSQWSSGPANTGIRLCRHASGPIYRPSLSSEYRAAGLGTSGCKPGPLGPRSRWIGASASDWGPGRHRPGTLPPI